MGGSGAYEIVAPIGAGGMGEVSRARDARLDRSVAIKVLPAEFARNAAPLIAGREDEREAAASPDDEFHLVVNPVAIGSGMRIFTSRVPLRLTASVAFANGEILNTYEPKR